MKHWLLKTEPEEWSWEDQTSNDIPTPWDGVRNKQAQKNLKSMSLGDLCFFYHSGKERRIVGVVKVTKTWYSEGDDEVVVQVEAVGEMRNPVGLKEMKEDKWIEDNCPGFVLFKQPRLSVVPVSDEVWARVCEMGGGYGHKPECR